MDISTFPRAELTNRSLDGPEGLILSLLIYSRHSTAFLILCKSALMLHTVFAKMLSGAKQLHWPEPQGTRTRLFKLLTLTFSTPYPSGVPGGLFEKGKKRPVLNTGNSFLKPFNNRHSNLTHRLSLVNEKNHPLLSRHRYIISKGYNDISSPRERQKDGVAKVRGGKKPTGSHRRPPWKPSVS